MKQSNKTHFATVERGNESNPFDEWSEPICGNPSEDLSLDDDWRYVSCKVCLKRKEGYETMMNQVMADEAEQLGAFLEMIEEEEKDENR